MITDTRTALRAHYRKDHMKSYWIVKDEATGTVLAVYPESKFNDYDEVIESHRNEPDHFTVDLKRKDKLTKKELKAL